MPGNETTYRSPRAYLPVIWVDNNLPPNATRELDIGGAPSNLHDLPIPKKCSVVSISVLLSEPVTAGAITVALCKNGVPSAEHVVVVPNGPTQIGELRPGAAVFDVGDTIGIHVTTPPGFAPAAQIDTIIFLEVQND